MVVGNNVVYVYETTGKYCYVTPRVERVKGQTTAAVEIHKKSLIPKLLKK